jgi:membrane protease YdiL (CAAX protease family)
LDAAALIFAMTYPSVMTWLEFFVLPGGQREHNPALQVVFGLGKFVQFSFPLAYVWLRERRLIARAEFQARGMARGIGFGLVVGLGALGLYMVWLRESPAFAGIPRRVYDWLVEFKMATPAGYLIMAAFIAVLHSFLEEYYWRWFVYGRLKGFLPIPAANLVSALAFMAHHVVVLSFYFQGYFWVAAVPFSLCVAGGGVAWAWLYQHHGSLLSNWISHLVVDAALMGLGYDMVSRFW